MGMPKKIKRNYVLNLLGVLVLFFGLFALFETGVLGSRNSYFMGFYTGRFSEPYRRCTW